MITRATGASRAATARSAPEPAVRIVARVVWTSERVELHAIVLLDERTGEHRLRIERVEHAPDSIDRAVRASVLTKHPAHDARVEITRSEPRPWLHADAPGLFAASFRRDGDAWAITYARLAGIDDARHTGMSPGAYEIDASSAEVTRND